MTSTVRTVALISIFLCSFCAIGTDEGNQLEVVSVTPSGDEVPVTRGEIIIEFNKTMVPLGQTDKDLSDVPVEIEPALQCTWRWKSATQLTCTHSDFLRYTTSYSITIGSSLQALDGSMLDSQQEFGFRTASLGVYGYNTHWRGPTQPTFTLSFSQPMQLRTILESVHIRDLRSSEVREVKVIHETDTFARQLFTSTLFRRHEDGDWIPASASEKEELLRLLQDEGVDRETHASGMQEFAARRWTIEPLEPLKPNTTYDLEVAANVKSIFATEPTTRLLHVSRFSVFPAFEFLGLECKDVEGSFKQHLVEGTNAKQNLTSCDPDQGITLLFTAPADPYDVKYRSLISPKPDDARNIASSRYYSNKIGELTYISRSDRLSRNEGFATDDDLSKVNIRYGLRGNTTYELRIGFAGLNDVFGRRLRTQTAIKFKTGHLRPRLDLDARWLVFNSESPLEIQADAANLTHLRVQLATEKRSGQGWNIRNKRQKLTLPTDQIASTTLDLENLFPYETGQFVAALEPIAGSKYGENPETPCIVGQVTPYDVHARIGYSSSIAWVTDLHTGQVVPDATVALIEAKDSDKKVLAESLTNKQGATTLPGRSVFATGDFERRPRESSSVFKDIDCQVSIAANYLLKVEGPKGQTVLPLSSIQEWDYSGPSVARASHLTVWGHTAQGLYRPGEVVQYKIFVREQTDEGLKVDENRRFRLVVIKGLGDLVFHQEDIELSRFGTFHGEFALPDLTFRTDEKLRFLVMIDKGEEFSSIWDTERDSLNYSEVDYWEALEVEVLDFKPATILVENSLTKSEYKRGEELVVEGRADLLGGGPLTGSPVVIDARLMPSNFKSTHPETKDYAFMSAVGRSKSWTLEDFQYNQGATDTDGTFSASLELDVSDVQYGVLTVSLGVQEDSGNIIWENTRTKYRSTDRFVGVRHIGAQSHLGEPLSVDTVIVDSIGTPKNDRSISLKYFRITHRNTNDPPKETLVQTCEIAENQASRACTITPVLAGHYRAVAEMKTTDGRVQQATQSIYVQGRVERVPDQERDYVRLANAQDLRERRFNVGEFASLVLDHSVPGALALVTVERLGIIDQWVTELKGSHDVIDVPIRPDYAPVVQATVTVTTVNSTTKARNFVPSTEQDSYPNSWKRSATLRVKDPTRELNVRVSTDKDVYEPGEQVRVAIEVSGDGTGRRSNTAELAIAVVDQGVLEVSRTGIQHFDPVKGLLESMAIDVQGFWLLNEGFSLAYSSRFHGDLDRTPRSNKDLTSAWLPVLETSDDGKATFEFEIGDRLTEWKIIAVAATAADKFGLGHTSVKTNLGVEIRPVLPNQVTDGDVFDASFSVLNRTDSEREVELEIRAEGDVEPLADLNTITLQSFERKLVSTRALARLREGQDSTRGSIRFLATASSGELSDALVQRMPVHPSKQLFVSSIYGTTTDATATEKVEFPDDITDESGSLEVQVTPSLISAVSERITEVRDYPYQCWEQRLSSAVVAAQYSQLKEQMGFDWQDTSQYIEEVLQSATKFQAPSGGFGYWSGESSHADLYLSAYTALAFQWLSNAGYQIPEPVLLELLDYLEHYTVYLLPDYLSLDQKSVFSLRLMLANALVQHGKGDLELVTKLYEENLRPSLFAIAQTLEAGIELDASDELLTTLSTRLTDSVGVIGDRALIQHGPVGRRNYMLSSQLKTTCSAISAFVRASKRGKQLISEERLAELVRGVVFEWNNQKHGANPHESSFCLSAIIEYAQSKESATDEFMVEVVLAMGEHLSQPQFVQPSDTKPNAISHVFTTPLKADYIGEPGDLLVKQSGDSRFYYKATLQYEPMEAQTERENFGIDIRKTYWIKIEDQWVEMEDTSLVRQGDVVHVGLYLDIRDQRDFVIVDDPVPGFLQPIDMRLAKTNFREVQPDTDRYGKLIPSDIEGDWSVLGSSRWGFYNQAISNDTVRFMSDFLPSGRYRLYWSGRVISTGEFLARPAHAESMYSPEIYGNSKPQLITVNKN